MDREALQNMWNDRYRESGTVFGHEANQLLVDVVSRHRPAGLPSTWAVARAATPCGWPSTGSPSPGWTSHRWRSNRRERMRAELGLDATFESVDLLTWDPAGRTWDLVVLAYIHLPERHAADGPCRGSTSDSAGRDDRRASPITSTISPTGTGGPRHPDWLFTEEQLADDFSDLEIVRNEQVVRTERPRRCPRRCVCRGEDARTRSRSEPARDGGQYRATTFHPRSSIGIASRTRLSTEEPPRLSPSTHTAPAGTPSSDSAHIGPSPHGSASTRSLIRICPFLAVTRSPGSPMTRLRRNRSGCEGWLKTTTSPRAGTPRRRWAITQSSGSNVGRIESSTTAKRRDTPPTAAAPIAIAPMTAAVTPRVRMRPPLPAESVRNRTSEMCSRAAVGWRTTRPNGGNP